MVRQLVRHFQLSSITLLSPCVVSLSSLGSGRKIKYREKNVADTKEEKITISESWSANFRLTQLWRLKKLDEEKDMNYFCLSLQFFYSKISYMIFKKNIKVHVLLNRIGLTPDSNVWIGAWWIGFLGAAVICFAIAIPILAFPAALPGE